MNNIYNNIGIILSYVIPIVSSIIITWFFSKKYQSKKKISCQCNNISIFEYKEDLSQDLEITYKCNKIKHLYKQTIAIWNSGTKEIRHEDFISSDLLKVQVGNNAMILDASIIKQSDAACNFKCEISDDRKTLYIDFAYLNSKDGLVLSILHSDNDIPQIHGNFIGLNEKIKLQDTTYRKERSPQAIMTLFAGIIVVAMMLIESKAPSNSEYILKSIIILVIVLTLFRLLIPPKKKLPHSLECDDLAKY